MKKVLLYSGGIDSWLINKLWKPDIKLYIDIHGMYSEVEKTRLPEDVIIVDFPLLGQWEYNNGYVPLRNLYFLMIASNYGDELCLGATAGDSKKDSNIDFLHYTEIFINYLLFDDTQRQIKIEKKFAKMNKAQILEKALEEGITIEQVYNNTFSCYNPINNKPCYNCIPCFRRFSLLYKHGYKYSLEERKKMYEYIKNNDINILINHNSENDDLIYTIHNLNNEFNK